MKLTILERKEIQHRTWYLCKGSLLEYLEELKENFYEYAIQRRIVKNQYLDKLYSTIQAGDPIPTITLTYGEKTLDDVQNQHATINLQNTEILDGLQRSFRLWAYLITSKLYADNQIDYRSFARKLKEVNPLFFDSGVMSTRLLKDLIENKEIEQIEELFSKYDIYFIVWAGLNEKEVIQKMLLLNAGQKSVSKTHQFELLFLHFFELINNERSNIKLYREKDAQANDIKRGHRDIGHFMFSSVIVALQSMVEGKPVRVSTEKLIEEEFKDTSDTSESAYDQVFNKDFLDLFLGNLYQLDQTIDTKDPGGKEWFSKDTSLSGIFAAIGKNIDFGGNQIKEQTVETFRRLQESIEKNGLQLEDFTSEYNVLSSRSVNIGNFIRKVVMEFTSSLLEEEPKTWREVFNMVKES